MKLGYYLAGFRPHWWQLWRSCLVQRRDMAKKVIEAEDLIWSFESLREILTLFLDWKRRTN